MPVFLESLAAQTRPPDRLLLVDDGSTDGSHEPAAEFAAEHEWAQLLRRPPRPTERDRLATAKELVAFQWGVTQLDVDWDVVGKVDNGGLSGEAKTSFKFADFELDKPRVRSVLSVEDDIGLEYTFALVPVK